MAPPSRAARGLAPARSTAMATIASRCPSPSPRSWPEARSGSATWTTWQRHSRISMRWRARPGSGCARPADRRRGGPGPTRYAVRRARASSPPALHGVEAELHRHLDAGCHGLAVADGRLEGPAAHGLDGGAIQVAGPATADHRDFARPAVRAHLDLQQHRALVTGALRGGGVGGGRPAQRERVAIG